MPILNIQFGETNAQGPDGQTILIPPHLGLVQRGPIIQVSLNLARATCIDRTVAEEMGLPTVDVVTMTSASHAASEQNVHPVTIEIIGPGITIDAPRAIGAELGAQGLLALVGHDVLSQCTLYYNGTTGQFTLSV
jgi:hypothetical protein